MTEKYPVPRRPQLRHSNEMLTAKVTKLEKQVKELALQVSQLRNMHMQPRTHDEAVHSKWKTWADFGTIPRRNGGIQCDMWTGPCSCGAWHTEGK